MPFTWVKPADPGVLGPRPLLDLGVGDGQTHAALLAPAGLRVGIDRSIEALPASGLDHAVAAEAAFLPFADGSFNCVLAADLFHHLGPKSLDAVLKEVRRVLSGGGRLVAWWYAAPGRGGPGDPQHPRAYEDVAKALRSTGFGEVSELRLTHTLEPAPATVGALAGDPDKA